MADQITTIPKGWKMTTLGQVLDIKNGKSRPGDGTQHPVYGGNGILGYADDYNIAEKTIIVGRVGAYCGSIFLEKEKFWLSDNALGVLAKKESTIAFLYYLLKKINLNKQAIGGAQPLLTQGVINQIEALVPEQVEEQRAIATVLSSFDDKIELLSEQNKTLEAAAQAIFKEWFVNFNFPGATGKMIDSEIGEIPEGWRVGEIKDLCKKLASGGTPATIKKDYYDGDIDWFSTKELQDNFIFESDKKITKTGLESSSAKVFPKGSVVMAIYAAPTVGRLGILGKEATFNQAACGFVANEEIASNEYIYLLLLSLRDDFNRLANGAAQQNLNVGLVKNFTIIIPDKIIMTQFKAIVTPIFGKILNNTSQIQTLSALRDTLLPKLMKGEVRVEGFNDQTL